MQFSYSEKGLALTKSFEGLRLVAYQDVAGVWTIGYGHTGPEVHKGLVWTEAQADAALRLDLQRAVACVNKEVTAQISQSKFDALVDFAFNDGCGSFQRSTLLEYVNAGRFDDAARQLLLWVNAGGKRSEGLVRRRTAEAALFAEA